jgi:predicted DNA-binding protein (MmcQ/YjbR family)
VRIGGNDAEFHSVKVANDPHIKKHGKWLWEAFSKKMPLEKINEILRASFVLAEKSKCLVVIVSVLMIY